MYDPHEYWQTRLSRAFNYRGVGFLTFSERYNRWLYRGKERALRKAFAEAGVVIRDRKACDLGCGTGFVVELLLRLGASRVDGIDITAASVDALSRRHPSATFVQGDVATVEPAALKPPYDVVTSLDVLYHIVDDDKFKSALALVSDLLAPRGYYVLTDRLEAAGSTAEHVRFRGLDEYQAELQPRGLTLVGRYFLYRFLNRSMGRLTPLLDRAAPLLWALDALQREPWPYNLQLAVFQKNAVTQA